jgi:hypothetical protein
VLKTIEHFLEKLKVLINLKIPEYFFIIINKFILKYTRRFKKDRIIKNKFGKEELLRAS